MKKTGSSQPRPCGFCGVADVPQFVCPSSGQEMWWCMCGQVKNFKLFFSRLCQNKKIYHQTHEPAYRPITHSKIIHLLNHLPARPYKFSHKPLHKPQYRCTSSHALRAHIYTEPVRRAFKRPATHAITFGIASSLLWYQPYLAAWASILCSAMLIVAFARGTIQSPPVTPSPRRTKPIPVCEPYEPTRNNKTLAGFQPIQLQTHCIFARRARLWGSCDWSSVVPQGSDNATLDTALRENVLGSLEAFANFARDCEKKRLHGFVFGAPGQYSTTKRRHGRTARVILQVCVFCNFDVSKLGGYIIRELYSVGSVAVSWSTGRSISVARFQYGLVSLQEQHTWTILLTILLVCM